VKVEGVSKKFCRSLKKSLWYGMCDIGSELLPFGRRRETRGENRVPAQPSSTIDSGPSTNSPSLREGEFLSVRDVSFELRRGECLGLIGKNGAGKTTLLKMLNGLIKPDSGQITMRGRIGALIALGAGFNPILTGRENIYVNGAVLGLSKREVDKKIAEIIDFAEIKDFIDTPVQSYSSGMTVRLGFSIASSMSPDILILDEVLAVGDSAFRNKCYERVGGLLGACAVILVTHNMAHISRICSSVMVLNRGKSIYYGETGAGISRYEKLNSDILDERKGLLHISKPATSGSFKILSNKISCGEKLSFQLELEMTEELGGAFLILMLYDSSHMLVAQWFSNQNGSDIHFNRGSNSLIMDVGPIGLRKGTYIVSAIVKDSSGVRQIFWSEKQQAVSIESNIYSDAAYQIL